MWGGGKKREKKGNGGGESSSLSEKEAHKHRVNRHRSSTVGNYGGGQSVHHLIARISTRAMCTVSVSTYIISAN